MKTKNFNDYLSKRLDKNTIKQIENQAKLEYQALQCLQQDVAKAMEEYMYREQIGFNEIARRLDMSPTQINKIKKGQANLTLATLAHIAALFQKTPKLIFS